MDTFAVNNGAKLVIIEQTAQGETSHVTLLWMYDPFCFARLWLWMNAVGFQSATK